jgi:hypothetical protein
MSVTLRTCFVCGSLLLASSRIGAQGPIHAVARDLDCLRDILRPSFEVDFEALPAHSSSCPSDPFEDTLANPLRLAGVTFTDPGCLRSGFCSFPTCSRDPDNPRGGNITLALSAGSTMEFPRGTHAAVLDIQGIGDNPFTLRATDTSGNTVEATDEGILFGQIYVVFTSAVGLSLVEILDVGGTGGSLVLGSLIFSGSRLENQPPVCDDPPPDDLGHLLPRQTGTVRFLPELGILDRAPVDSDVQSTYGRTTDENRQFRRGFLEFRVPDVRGEIVKAELNIRESRATTSHPRPPDLHELSSYAADLEVNTQDFDRPTTVVDFFETDANLPTSSFSFDVKSLVQDFRGKNLGFRIRLAGDQDFEGFDSLGSGFGSIATDSIWLEINTANPSFRRGDCDGDGQVTGQPSDAVFLLNFNFLRGREPPCLAACDVDGDGQVTGQLSDAVFLLNFNFLGGAPPPVPFGVCGVGGPGDFALGCHESTAGCQ